MEILKSIFAPGVVTPPDKESGKFILNEISNNTNYEVALDNTPSDAVLLKIANDHKPPGIIARTYQIVTRKTLLGTADYIFIDPSEKLVTIFELKKRLNTKEPHEIIQQCFGAHWFLSYFRSISHTLRRRDDDFLLEYSVIYVMLYGFLDTNCTLQNPRQFQNVTKLNPLTRCPRTPYSEYLVYDVEGKSSFNYSRIVKTYKKIRCTQKLCRKISTTEFKQYKHIN